MNQPSNRQPESRPRSNFFAILSCWIAFSVLPTLLCGLAPTIFPKILADFFSLEKALPIWAGMVSLGFTIFWPLHLNQVDLDLSEDARSRWSSVLQSFVLLILVSLPSLTMVSGLSVHSREEILKTAVYLSALGFSILLLSRWAFWLFPGRSKHRGTRGFWIMTLAVALNGVLPLFLSFASVFRAKEFDLTVRSMTPVLSSQHILEGADLGPALMVWLGLILAFAVIFGFARILMKRLPFLALSSLLVLLALPGQAHAEDDPMTVIKAESLLGSKARVGHSYPIRLYIGRKASGQWSGNLIARLGKRAYKVPLTVHGGTLDSPQHIDLSLVFYKRQRLSFEAESADGTRVALPFRWPSVNLVDSEDPLIGAWGSNSLRAAQAYVSSDSSLTSPALLLSGDLHQSLALGGDALDLVFLGSGEPAKSRRVSLLRYVAQGGILVLFGEGKSLSNSFPVTYVPQGSFEVGRLGSGLVLKSDELLLSDQSLGDLGQLLGPRLNLDGRGRFYPEGVLESFLRAPQAPKARLGLRFALAGVLVALVLILTLYGFPKSAESEGPHIVFRVLSQQVLGGVAFVVLALVLILRWALLPSSLTTIEALRIEEGVVGSAWFDQTAVLKLRSAIDAPEQALDFALSTSLRGLETEESASFGEELWEKRASGEWRLTMPLKARDSSLFLTKDLRSLGKGLSLRREKGKLWLRNGLGLNLKNLLLAQGERSFWLASLPADEDVLVRMEEKPWYDWVESELDNSLEKNLYYCSLPQRESYLERGGVILCQPEDDGLRRQIGDRGVEVGPTRLLMVTWLNQELAGDE
ncbi:MAG: hypothetical protein P1V97_13845 [Planctomycetota bacterium]|nr:hypothetical protein [Planctomycetota bacterium]